MKRILIIDDDASHSTSTREILATEGYEVEVHDRAFGATALAGKIRPDLILLDVNMPGLSGEGLASLLRKNPRTENVPILLYSSNDEDDLRAAARTLGLAGYVAKGSVPNLRRRVAEALGQVSTR